MLGRRRHGRHHTPPPAPGGVPSRRDDVDLAMLPPPAPAAPAAAPPSAVLPAVELPAWARTSPPRGEVDLVFSDGHVERLAPADPRVRPFLAAADVLLTR